MSLYIGIEGVGLRQSVAVVADAKGRILSAYRMLGEPLFLQTTDRNLLRTRLTKIIREVAFRAGRNLSDLEDAIVCIGLSGVTFPYDADVDLPTEFSKLGIRIKRLVCTGDAEIVFASHAHAAKGSAIVCNMGSTAFVATPENFVRYGGWGPAIGDEGSGYWIGKEVLRAIGEEFDRGDEPTELWKAIDKWLSKPNTCEYADWIGASLLWRKRRLEYEREKRAYDKRTAICSFAHAMSLQKEWEWRAVLSSLTIPLMRAWEQGNEAAENILARAADHLVRQYKHACVRAKVPGTFSPLVLYGGVLTHNSKFRGLVVEKLSRRLKPPCEVLTPTSPKTMRPACGALLYALGDSLTGALRLPSHEVINTLAVEQENAHTSGELNND